MAKEYPHIFLQDSGKAEGFTSRPGRGKTPNVKERVRQAHSERLREQWAAIWRKAKQQDEQRTAVSMPPKGGVNVEFEGLLDYDLVTKSLEDMRSGIRLMSVYSIRPDTTSEQEIKRATVFIPTGKEEHFLRKINEYARKETPNKGNPRHRELMESIEGMRIAVLESYWRDLPELLPQGDDSVWCEFWLRGIENPIEARFRIAAATLGVPVQARSIRFPERRVLIGRATQLQLIALIEDYCDICELRRAKESAQFFLEMGNRDQTEWVKDLIGRLQVQANTDVAVCILDTGANNGHDLLVPVLADIDRHSVEPDWGVNDHDGHGTLMCGVVAFGDLQDALEQNGQITIRHCLESVKILPTQGNVPELYGEITIQGMSRAELQAPTRKHIGCMAITSKDGRDGGRPSSWSSAIDALTSGCHDDAELKRLFIVSAGNISEQDQWDRYPISNQDCQVHDPGQAWNALTIGAYTEKSNLTDPVFIEHVPLAQPGELSPFSTTSTEWDTKWPSKPDIVLEGGNLAKAPDDVISEYDDLSLLSTGHTPTIRQLRPINATSAATAQAAWMAAQIQARYPEAWPETVRGLLIHSAEWPDALKEQFLTADGRGKYSKSEYGRLLRICGYGVPDLSRALACASNSLTLIAQAELQPYCKKEGNSGFSTKDMHLHQVPWPREVLLNKGEMPVTLRITLSYFIEPGPGEFGGDNKYRYASHGLHFDLNTHGETEGAFMRRINAASHAEEERSGNNKGSGRWDIGVSNRNVGSVHSDILHSTAAEIATCNLIGVYPIIGWWRERSSLGRWNRKARYSLIVSLHTPDASVDIYSPVAIKLGIPIEI